MKKAASACLCGIACRYNGKEVTNLNENEKKYLPVCPEILGGLSAPRTPVEIQGNIINNSYDDLVASKIKVVDKEGNDYSQIFIESADKGLKIILDNDIEEVLLKDGSPTCGCNLIYDGTFTSNKIAGNGVFCALLKKYGIKIIEWSE